MLRSYPTADVFRRRLGTLADPVVILGVLALFYVLARVGAGMISPYSESASAHVSLDARNLPYDAARSLVRMFLALVVATIFSLVYATAAARSQRAEKVLVPLLDILQSVPVLGFLSITVTGFIGMSPGNTLGVELASIFAIFTAQAWNMTFSFYHSLITEPREITEMTKLYRLSPWQRFVSYDLPNGMIGLIWNGMMSVGGGWFFLAASEAITVLNHQYTLPGVGSYLAVAVNQKDFHHLFLALLTMVIVVVAVDRLFWRPLVAWSEKFKFEDSAASERPESAVLNLLRRARVVALVGRVLAAISEAIDQIMTRLWLRRRDRPANSSRAARIDAVYNVVLTVLFLGLVAGLVNYILRDVGLNEAVRVLGYGALTLLRVLVLIVFAALVWTPIGVWIGFNPRVSRIAQPVVQVLASFPANFLFPFITIFFLRTHTSLNYGAPLLMALGAQWYILFNSIAGAMAIPNDLRQAAQNFHLRGWRLWRDLILPGIFPFWVTGAITASGGAWNASIVSEIVSWGQLTLRAQGLGAYITDATATGDWPRIVLGVGVMSLFVVALNRLLWRRLYVLAEKKYKLD